MFFFVCGGKKLYSRTQGEGKKKKDVDMSKEEKERKLWKKRKEEKLIKNLGVEGKKKKKKVREYV